MDSKYNYIKKILSEDNSPPPTELRWENMQDGIFEKMKQMEQVPQKNTSYQWWSYALLLSALLVPFVCMQTHKKNTSGVHTSTVSPTQTTVPQEDKTVPAPTLPPAPIASDSPTNSSKTTSVATRAIAPKTNNGQTRLSFSTPLSDAKNKQLLPSTTTDVKKIWSPTTHTNQAQVPVYDKVLNAPPTAAVQVQPIPTRLPTLWTTIWYATEKNSFPSILRRYSTPADKHETTLPNRIALSGGVSWWNAGYSNNQTTQASHEQPIPSLHTQLHYTHTTPKGMVWLAGLQVVQLESRFEWEEQLENYRVVLEDTIVQIQTNSFTGNQTFVRGDVEVPVAAKRVVKHYNRTRLYQIPLAIGKTWSKNRWQTEVLIGTSLNIVSTNTGRTLHRDTILSYETEDEFRTNQWGVQALLMGRSSYRLTQQWGLQVGLQFQKSLNNWSAKNGIGMRPYIFLTEVGLVYSF